MLKENIKTIRKSKGLSQEELAVRLNVVRQTVSKWEQGLSVPDAEMLISIAGVLETPVSTLLGETVAGTRAEDLSAISEKLEVLNLQLARRAEARKTRIHWFFIFLFLAAAAALAVLTVLRSPYLGWDYSHPETAVIGVALHACEWLFVRIAPFVLAGAIAGACRTRKRA